MRALSVLVTGAGGQLGREVVLACEAAGDTVFALGRTELDVTDRDAVLGVVTTHCPDLVVHCAAWTAVDACEADAGRAMTHNALAVRFVAEGCARVGAHLVHVSTDYVFDGAKESPYDEWDEPNPQSVYGRSKLAGEHEALVLGTGAAVVRTSWLCGEHGPNMVKTILRLAGERDELSFVDDQVGCPSFTADLAPMLRRLGVDRRSGIHHVTNGGAVSWFGFAQEVLRAGGMDAGRVRPIATSDLHPARPAPRPANSVLDNCVLRANGLRPLRDFRGPLAELVGVLTSAGPGVSGP